MFVRPFLLICLALGLAGCHHSTMVSSAAPGSSSYLYQKVPDFNRVSVDGRFNVNLHTGYSHTQVILKGDSRDLAYVHKSVANGVLQVSLAKGYPKFGTIKIDIASPYLNSFKYHGSGTVTGNQLHTSLLDLSIDNQGNTNLNGQLGIHTLFIAGNGFTEISGINSPALILKLSGHPKIKLSGLCNLTSLDLNNNVSLSMYWIKSRALTIRAHGKGMIQLAGTVEFLDVELWGSAHFKGRYLRADRAFIKTHNSSVAEISAVKRQHTLASDNSDIRFYNVPVMKAGFMDFNGALLDMRDLGSPFVQEYNQYNK